MKTFRILGVALLVAMLVGLVLGIACGSAPSTPTSSPTSSDTSDLSKHMHEAWLNQRGSGMFFGTGPDPSISLNVSGLATQFSDNTALWLKVITPGSFNSLSILFRVEKAQMSSQGTIISKQYVTEFSIPTNPQDNTARFRMPAFSIGPGEYVISAYRTDGSLCIARMMKYLAPGEQPDPDYSGGMW